MDRLRANPWANCPRFDALNATSNDTVVVLAVDPRDKRIAPTLVGESGLCRLFLERWCDESPRASPTRIESTDLADGCGEPARCERAVLVRDVR